MALHEEIISFASAFSGGKPKRSEETDFFRAFGLDGEDASEFLEEFGDKFSVDLTQFRWEFHYNADEPPGFRRVLPIGKDGLVIPYEPVTLADLIKSAEVGRWEYDYPEYTIKESRWAGHRLLFLFLSLFVLLGYIASNCA